MTIEQHIEQIINEDITDLILIYDKIKNNQRERKWSFTFVETGIKDNITIAGD